MFKEKLKLNTLTSMNGTIIFTEDATNKNLIKVNDDISLSSSES